MGFISLITGNWKLMGIGLLLVALAGLGVYNEILKLQKADLTTENKSLKGQLEQSQANVLQLKTNIDQQNKAIDDIKSAADKHLAEQQGQLNAAKVVAAAYKKKAVDIMTVVKPDGVSDCNASNDLFNQAITNAKN